MHTYPLALPHHDEWHYGVVEPEGAVVTMMFDYPPEMAAVSTLGIAGSALLERARCQDAVARRSRRRAAVWNVNRPVGPECSSPVLSEMKIQSIHPWNQWT